MQTIHHIDRNVVKSAHELGDVLLLVVLSVLVHVSLTYSKIDESHPHGLVSAIFDLANSDVVRLDVRVNEPTFVNNFKLIQDLDSYLVNFVTFHLLLNKLI